MKAGFTMTEEEWLACTNPTPMLELFRRGDAARMSVRKRRLFACACCRRIQGLLDREGVARVEAAERFADDPGGHDGLVALGDAAAAAAGAPRAAALAACRNDNFATVRFAAHQAVFAVVESFHDPAWASEKKEQADLLREIAGNPFRQFVVDPRWLTTTAVGLARSIYEERAFDRLPILADALEDAGCDGPELLSHCRGDGPHVRGCWAVDLMLGKE
jgi:hypothetical protein